MQRTAGDERFLASGVLRYGNGYEIWHDVLLGEIFFVLALVVYEAYRWWNREGNLRRLVRCARAGMDTQ